jgi:AcrR family transcriptional regulator
VADRNHPESPVDGRSLRSVRTRRSVIEAFLDLLNEGEEQPTSHQVADRSGVSPSTIFRLFEDLDGMYAEALSIQAERVADLLVPIPPGGAVEDRVERQVRARRRLYEKVAPLIRFHSRQVPGSPGARSNREQVNAYFRAELAALFAAELSRAPERTLDAIDALTSWEMWERLRTTQGLSVRQAEKMIRVWVVSALGVRE